MADEKSTENVIKDEKELTRQGVILNYVQKDVDALNKKVDSLIAKIDDKYVTHEEYDIYKKAVADFLAAKSTKEELEPVKQQVSDINANIRWVVLFLVTCVLGGVMSLVIIK